MTNPDHLLCRYSRSPVRPRQSAAPQRLVRVFNALFGRLPGGPAVVTVLVCTFFTAFTGRTLSLHQCRSGAGRPAHADSDRRRGTRSGTLGLVTGAGSLGTPLFPPCLPLIVYGIVARIYIKAGVSRRPRSGGGQPLVTAWWASGKARRARPHGCFDAREALAAAWDAKWQLLTPVVAVAALFSGKATTVEAAALTALYVVIVEVVLHRDLRLFSDMPRVLTECGLLIGGIPARARCRAGVHELPGRRGYPGRAPWTGR